jgi:large subunit ribosomal protein L29
MKITEIRELTVDEINAQIQDSHKALFDARFKHSMHQLDNTAELRQLRHRIAQLKTVLNEKSRKA